MHTHTHTLPTERKGNWLLSGVKPSDRRVISAIAPAPSPAAKPVERWLQHLLSEPVKSLRKTTLKRDHPDERPPQWETILNKDSRSILIRDHLDERPLHWETTLNKDSKNILIREHPEERPPQWETTLNKDSKSILFWDHPDERPLQWERGCPDERPLQWETTLNKDSKSILIRDHPSERPPWTETERASWPETTLIKDHPDERPHWIKTQRASWLETILRKDHTHDRPLWRETTLMRDSPWWEEDAAFEICECSVLCVCREKDVWIVPFWCWTIL